MNKKVCKILILMVIMLGLCTMGKGVYAAEVNTQSNVVATQNEVSNVDAQATLSNEPAATTAVAVPASTTSNDSSKGIGLVGAALATGLACIGAGIAVAVVASSAIGAISENPSLFGKTIIFAGLAEGIAIYGLIISIMILSKF